MLGRYDLHAALQTGPYSFYQDVNERCGLFWGLLDRTLLRDEGRAFLEAGGHIEQADMVLRMLRVAIPSGSLDLDPPALETEGRCDRGAGRRAPVVPLPPQHHPPAARTTMNFAIRYLTEYDYDAEVLDNLNPLRVKPATGSRQRCDEFSVRLTPEVRLHRHTDYFGTEVVEFEISRPHRHLTIDVRARVSTQPHVKVGHGRHYADVPPIKGVYRGQASASLSASVTMTRVECPDPASISRP